MTDATRRLEDDATRALDPTAATRALPPRQATAVRPPATMPPVRREAPVQRRPERRRRRSPVRAIALILIALLALAAIILALSLPGGNRESAISDQRAHSLMLDRMGAHVVRRRVFDRHASDRLVHLEKLE